MPGIRQGVLCYLLVTGPSFFVVAYLLLVWAQFLCYLLVTCTGPVVTVYSSRVPS